MAYRTEGRKAFWRDYRVETLGGVSSVAIVGFAAWVWKSASANAATARDGLSAAVNWLTTDVPVARWVVFSTGLVTAVLLGLVGYDLTRRLGQRFSHSPCGYPRVLRHPRL